MIPISVEVSRDLIPLFEEADANGSNRILQVLTPQMRDELHMEFGFQFPGIRYRGNETDMPLGTALVLIEEIPETFFGVVPDTVAVDATIETLATFGISGEVIVDSPVPGVRARIKACDRPSATAAGITSWDVSEYLVQVVGAVCRRFAAEFVDLDVVKHLTEPVDSELVARVVPGALSWFELTGVMRQLVAEGFSIANVPGILGAFASGEPQSRDPLALAERARRALAEQMGLDAKLPPKQARNA